MRTNALATAGNTTEVVQQPGHLTWGVVELQVTDLDRAVAFWTSALGLQVRDHSGSGIALGTQTRKLFVLHSGAVLAVNPEYSGMYHVALSVPSQSEFSRMWARLIALGVPVAPVDHLLSKSIYISDPDGLEIGITLETPGRFGRFGDTSKNIILYDSTGQPHSGREYLDVEAELLHLQDFDLDAPLSEGALLEHLHLKVPELTPALEWFKGIGFSEILVLPQLVYADMGAGATNTHRLAMNTWAGPNLPPTPDNMARLIHYELCAPDTALITNARGLHSDEKGLSGHDPTGTRISLISVQKKEILA